MDPSIFNFISDLVREKSAIVLDMQEAYLVELRLAPLLRAHGLPSLDSLVRELRRPSAGALTKEVVEAMTTNETSFFRDILPFQALKEKVLPAMIEQRRQTRKLTIWSNACSSGQEPFTIAMVIREHFPELADWKIQIIATDLCSKVLERAREGLFNQTEINRGLPLAMLLKYFRKERLQWQIDESIRRSVDFRVVNLVEPWPPLPPVDIIFLRNVLIYFDVSTKSQLLKRARSVLPQDGCLFLGGSETTMNLDAPFRRDTAGNAVFYRPT